MDDTTMFESGMYRLLRCHYRDKLPEESVTLEIMAVYWDALSDLTDAEFTAAVRASLATQAFFPKPAELRDFARPQKPKRNPQDDFDLMAGALANRQVDPTFRLLQLPDGMTPEQAAQRALDWQRLVAETLAQIRAGGEKVKAGRRPNPPSRHQRLPALVPNPDADALLDCLPGPTPEQEAADLAAWKARSSVRLARFQRTLPTPRRLQQEDMA